MWSVRIPTCTFGDRWKGIRNLSVLEFEMLAVLRVEVLSLLFSDWLEDEAFATDEEEKISRNTDDDWILRKKE